MQIAVDAFVAPIQFHGQARRHHVHLEVRQRKAMLQLDQRQPQAAPQALCHASIHALVMPTRDAIALLSRPSAGRFTRLEQLHHFLLTDGGEAQHVLAAARPTVVDQQAQLPVQMCEPVHQMLMGVIVASGLRCRPAGGARRVAHGRLGLHVHQRQLLAATPTRTPQHCGTLRHEPCDHCEQTSSGASHESSIRLPAAVGRLLPVLVTSKSRGDS